MPSSVFFPPETVGASPKDISIMSFASPGQSDYTSALQEAVSFASSIPGGRVVIPGGTYKISGTVTLPTGGGTLTGIGQNASILQLANNSNVDMINIQGQFWTIKDLGFDGNYPSNGTAGDILVISATKTMLSNLWIANARKSGIHAVGTVSQPAHATLSANVYILSCQGAGLHMDAYSYDSKFVNLWIGSGAAQGILLDNAAGGSGPSQCHFTNLHSWGNAAEGVKSSSGDHLRFTNCYIETNSGKGMSLNSCKGAMISGSHFWANVGHGLYLFNSPQAVISACQFTDNSNGVSNQDGIQGDGTSTDVSVSGCYFGINNDGGVTSHQKYGIETISSCDRWTITGNNIRASQHATGSTSLVGAANLLSNNQV